MRLVSGDAARTERYMVSMRRGALILIGDVRSRSLEAFTARKRAASDSSKAAWVIAS